MNKVKEKLKRGDLALGQIVMELFTQGTAPMLSAAGVEFAIFDMEHGRCDIALLQQLVVSCRGTGVVPLARVPDLDWAPLARVLDVGARGVMLPRIEDRGQLQRAVEALKYAPQGKRGVALGVAHDLYQAQGPAYFKKANADTLVIAIMETAKAFEHLDDIISVPGLDVAWMGHYDLTVSMGIPAQFDHPRFLQAMDDLVTTCERHKVAPGFMVTNPQEALHWIGKGFRAISLGSDISTYMGSVRQFQQTVVSQLAASVGRKRAKSKRKSG